MYKRRFYITYICRCFCGYKNMKKKFLFKGFRRWKCEKGHACLFCLPVNVSFYLFCHLCINFYDFLYLCGEGEFCTSKRELCTCQNLFCTGEREHCTFEKEPCTRDSILCTCSIGFCTCEIVLRTWDIKHHTCTCELCTSYNLLCTFENELPTNNNKQSTNDTELPAYIIHFRLYWGRVIKLIIEKFTGIFRKWT